MATSPCLLLLALAALCLASSCNRPREWSVQSGVAEAVRPIQLQRNGMRVEDVSNLATAADVPGVVLIVAKSCPWCKPMESWFMRAADRADSGAVAGLWVASSQQPWPLQHRHGVEALPAVYTVAGSEKEEEEDVWTPSDEFIAAAKQSGAILPDDSSAMLHDFQVKVMQSLFVGTKHAVHVLPTLHTAAEAAARHLLNGDADMEQPVAVLALHSLAHLEQWRRGMTLAAATSTTARPGPAAWFIAWLGGGSQESSTAAKTTLRGEGAVEDPLVASTPSLQLPAAAVLSQACLATNEAAAAEAEAVKAVVACLVGNTVSSSSCCVRVGAGVGAGLDAEIRAAVEEWSVRQGGSSIGGGAGHDHRQAAEL